MLQDLPPDFDFVHLAPVLWVFAMWWLYTPVLNLLGHGTLNTQLHAVRLKWMVMMLNSQRENRVFDAIILGQISSAMSYFGSATLIVLVGMVGALASINLIHASFTQMPFVPKMSLELFSVYFAALTAIVARCYFAFTYGLRTMAYTLAMIGGLDEHPASTPQLEIMTAQTAVVLTSAVRSMNSGIRGYYFLVGGIMLFAGPMLSILATTAMALLLYYRQVLSTEAMAIERYVKAMRGGG
jgi:uncharacterized membrane protein